MSVESELLIASIKLDILLSQFMKELCLRNGNLTSNRTFANEINITNQASDFLLKSHNEQLAICAQWLKKNSMQIVAVNASTLTNNTTKASTILNHFMSENLQPVFYVATVFCMFTIIFVLTIFLTHRLNQQDLDVKKNKKFVKRWLNGELNPQQYDIEAYRLVSHEFSKKSFNKIELDVLKEDHSEYSFDLDKSVKNFRQNSVEKSSTNSDKRTDETNSPPVIFNEEDEVVFVTTKI